MPFFEYRCLMCSTRYTILVGMAAEKEKKVCPRCGSTKANKLISRFRRLRSEEETVERLADPSAIGDLSDPQSLRRWAKRLSKEMGEDMGDEFDEMLEQEMEKEARKSEAKEEEKASYAEPESEDGSPLDESEE